MACAAIAVDLGVPNVPPVDAADVPDEEVALVCDLAAGAIDEAMAASTATVTLAARRCVVSLGDYAEPARTVYDVLADAYDDFERRA